ncbi:hypothetical protein J6S88_01495 [bacterium]|nr:hypothetical protein [bacterium]
MVKAQTDFNDYKNKTFEELDREVEQAVREDRNRKIVKIVICCLVIFFIFPDAFLYWFRFATPHFPKYKTDEIIEVDKDPVQVDLPDSEDKYIKYYTLEKKGSYKLKKLAEYSISGKVVAKNFFFWGNYLPKGKRAFQSVALFDIGLVWGKMADNDILNNYKFISAKSAVARTLYPRLKYGTQKSPLTWDEAQSKFSHTHVIPATPSVMYALLNTGKNQPVKMEGYLVDVYDDGKVVAQTSLSRIDTNKTARGGGACEIMYVEKVQLKNKVYE